MCLKLFHQARIFGLAIVGELKRNLLLILLVTIGDMGEAHLYI